MREIILKWYEEAVECEHQTENWVCMKDPDSPHRCNIALCPEEKLDLRERAQILEGKI